MSFPPSHFASGPRSVLEIEEPCGLVHESQVVVWEYPAPADVFAFRHTDGRLFPAQRSHQNPAKIYLTLALSPHEKLVLTPEVYSAEPFLDTSGTVSTPHFSLELVLGEDASARSGFDTSGPIRHFSLPSSPRRGRSFFDARQPVLRSMGEILESGPVRLVHRYRVDFADGGFYESLLTVDHGQTFVRLQENFQADSGDQIVWDFSGSDRPSEFIALGSTAAYRRQPLAYHFDNRLARLAAWTQQSQHLDFVDGFALLFADGGVLGLVTLEGGSWQGDRLNHLEAWTRRWLPGDPASRRDVPATAKADSYPSPERVPARGGVLCEEHFNVEGWIGRGKREFALVFTSLDAIQPVGNFSEEPLGHFEDQPDRARYARQQSLLRRIHVRHGVLPLQRILEGCFVWPHEEPRPGSFSFPHAALDRHFKVPTTDPAVVAREMQEYLAARVYGFWEGSGVAYSNPVVSRRIAPEMFRYEWLRQQGVLSAESDRSIRAHFAFLALLFSSENYYTGDPTMLPAESPDSTEPSLAGMANQNFYTDVINIFGTAAQIFHQHPLADAWRARFLEQWHKQLAFHVYPESGLWEESHTYFLHVLHTILPTLLRRRADGAGDEFAHPAFQKLVASALKQVTPRDAALGGRRSLIAFGDHGRTPQPDLFADLAEAFHAAAPDLAAQLRWLAQEMGASLASETAITPPPWQNEAVQGLGFFFRAIDRYGQESLLALRSGNAWGHHHNDDGSIQFFAFGHALIGDSVFGENQPDGRKFSAAGHSRWTLRDVQPVNHYWRFNRGWVTRAELTGRFPFVESCGPIFTIRGGLAETEVLTPPVLHWRSILQIDATTFLVVDTSRSTRPQAIRFHLAGHQVEQRDGGVLSIFPGGQLRLQPLFANGKFPLTLTPLASGTRHATTEVAYEIGLASFAAFVFRASSEGDDFDLQSSPDHCVLSATDWQAEVRRLSNDSLEVVDRASGHQTIFHLVS